MKNQALLKIGAAAILAAGLFVGIPTFAQEATQDATQDAAPAMAMPPLPGDLVIGDLNTPRGIAFDANGNLLVSVTGNGGSLAVTAKGPDGEMAFNVGMSGQVLSVDNSGH